MRWGLSLVVAVAVMALTGHARAGDANDDALDALRHRLEAMERRHREEVRALREAIARIAGEDPDEDHHDHPRPGLEDAVDELLHDHAHPDPGSAGAWLRPPGAGASEAWLDISVRSTFVVGGSTADEADLERLQAGAHDPRKRGFQTQGVELALSGAVDRHLRGDAAVIYQIDPEGETTVELEEAFLTTTSLPGGWEVRAGQYFTEFGRDNARHPHAWSFVNRPVIATRLFGPDGMRGPGARVAWSGDEAVPLRVVAGAQNANGETMTSFLSTDEEDLPGGRPHAGGDVHAANDLVWSGRAGGRFGLGDGLEVRPGASVAAGPNASGASGRTRILGVDLLLLWRPEPADPHGPFVAWETEVLHRRWHGDRRFDPVAGFFPHETLTDRGWWSQVVWGFAEDWTVGVRYGRAHGSHDGSASDPLRDRRSRWSAALTRSLGTASRLRLQVDRDRSEALGRALSVWLQVEFDLGRHPEHEF